MTDLIIECENYTYRYGENAPALKDLSFVVRALEHTAVLGLNGSGKSTLLRSLVGLLRGEGVIRVLGLEVKKQNFRQIRQRVGLVFQDPQVQLFCPTVIEDVAFGPVNLHGDEERARKEAEEALEAVGYSGNYFTPCNALSLGEMRKVALAGILVLRPDILLLDEPDSYLDREGKERLLQILHSLKGITRILVTHDVEFASALCHRGLYLQEGEIGFHGPLTELKEKI